MQITQFESLIYLPFVLPICLYVAFTDLREMRIPNHATDALAILFVVLGLIALPFDSYLWRLAQFVIVLVVGFVLNAGGAIGAGDAKFIAVAAPYVAAGDALLIAMIFAAALLGAVTTHRAVKRTSLRNIAPHWKSWEMGKKFPMGLALGGTMAFYLCLGALMGS